MNEIKNDDLKTGDVLLLRDKPCEIVEILCSKTGKHGVAKLKIKGRDIFTGLMYEDILVRQQATCLPTIFRRMFIVLGVGDKTIQLQRGKDTPFDVDLVDATFSEEIKTRLNKNEMVCVELLSYETMHKIKSMYNSG